VDIATLIYRRSLLLFRSDLFLALGRIRVFSSGTSSS